jgi:hypothetical protein
MIRTFLDLYHSVRGRIQRQRGRTTSGSATDYACRRQSGQGWTRADAGHGSLHALLFFDIVNAKSPNEMVERTGMSRSGQCQSQRQWRLISVAHAR